MPTDISALATSLRDRYVIDREIGAGGMATVYLARDVKHNRNVALKVLRPDLGAVLGVERFLSEIQVTANLQHPNLLPLFDSGEAGGHLFYVMPYVEGESLRARLDREKQLPVDEAVHIAAAIAGALDHAHKNGVIHRDLKPENTLLQSGQPVIADFGIALAVSNAGAGRVTQTGISLGTPQYMSPEQATGDRIIDGRTDIYSLGAMLFEMLAGDPPHHGSTSQAIIAKVLTERAPSVRVSRPNVPEHVDAAIERALEKLPADRFATAREFGDAISGRVTVRSVSATTAREAASAKKRRLLAPVPITIGLVAGAAIAAGALTLSREKPVAPPIARFALDLGEEFARSSMSGSTLAVSRDGSRIAYVANDGGARAIHVRSLDALESVALPRTGNATQPRFSPDGKWVYFSEGTPPAASIRKIPREGGPVSVVVDGSANGSWSDDGFMIYAGASTANRGIWRVNVNGGKPEHIADADTSLGETSFTRPWVLPGSKAAIVEIRRRSSTDSATLGVIRIPGGEVVRLGVYGVSPRYLPTGHIIFGRMDGSIATIAFDPKQLSVSGNAVTVLSDVVVKGGGAVEFSLSDNGALLYTEGTGPSSTIARVNRSGAVQPYAGVPAQRYQEIRLSPDGKRLAFAIPDPGSLPPRTDVWILDIASSTLSRLTNDGKSSRPEWTRDSRRVVWRFQDGEQNEVRWAPWDKSAEPEVFLQRDADPLKSPIGVSFGGAGDSFAYVTFGTGAPSDIGVASLTPPRNPRLLIATQALEKAPRVSPNGRWLAYVSSESGSQEVYVRPFPGGGGRVKVSTEGGNVPMWSPSGNELFYHRVTGALLMKATFVASPEFSVVTRDTVMQMGGNAAGSNWPNYDIAPGGDVIITRSTSAAGRTILVLNWFRELKEKMDAAQRP